MATSTWTRDVLSLAVLRPTPSSHPHLQGAAGGSAGALPGAVRGHVQPRHQRAAAGGGEVRSPARGKRQDPGKSRYITAYQMQLDYSGAMH